MKNNPSMHVEPLPEPLAGQEAVAPFGYLYCLVDGEREEIFSRARRNEYFRNDPWVEMPLYANPLPLMGREMLAEAIHKARWPKDRATEITPFADEDRNGREYCFRIADAILQIGRGK